MAARGVQGVRGLWGLGLRPRTGAVVTSWTRSMMHTRPKTPAAWSAPHMSELPVPCGSWGQHYQKQQQYYNKWLAMGIATFVSSFLAMVGTHSFFANWAPPLVPAPHQHSPSVFEPEDSSLDQHQPMHRDDPDPCAE